MPSDTAAVVAIIMIASITYASRLAGALLMNRATVSTRIERFLNALSVSVTAALVASIVAQNGLREAVAVMLAAVIMLGTKNAVWAMAGGMMVAALWALSVP